MRIKKILVTGAGGKIGRNLLPALIEAGYQVRALEFEETIADHNNEVEVVPGDLRDTTLAPRIIKGMDAVIHLANCKENRALFMDTNIKGTFYLLDAVKNCRSIRQFIQAGSDARAGIYYYPHPFPIDENYPHRAYPGYYAFSKVLEETMGEQYIIQYGLPITTLRFSWVFDEDDILAHCLLKGPGFGVPIWKDLAKSRRQKRYFEERKDAVAKLIHPGGKPGIRHVVGVKDVVQGILLSIGNQAALGQAFTITGPAPFSYGYLAEYVAQQLGLPVVEFVCAEYHDFEHNIAKARSILGYNPQYDITRIVDEAIAFRKSGQKRSAMIYIG